MVETQGEKNKGFGSKLRKELTQYALISAYLYVCFSILVLYETALLADHGVAFAPFGIAVVKALIIGKFILIGEAIPLVHGQHLESLIIRVAWKSIALLLVLFVFTIVEELIVGWVHDLSAADAMAEFFGRPILQIIAPILVMLMILVPLVGISELGRSMEQDGD